MENIRRTETTMTLPYPLLLFQEVAYVALLCARDYLVAASESELIR